MSDFDLMLERKKEEMRKRRRKRRDVDIINDNDDLIDDLIRRMMEAAEVPNIETRISHGFYSVYKKSFMNPSHTKVLLLWLQSQITEDTVKLLVSLRNLFQCLHAQSLNQLT